MSYKKIIPALSPTILLLLLLTPTTAFAKGFYSYFMRGSYYGIWADISTPATAPITPITYDPVINEYTHRSHSLTTPGGASWAQVGWLYYPGNLPLQYYEYLDTLGNYDLVYVGNQQWGTTVKYEVSHNGAQTWCVWIGGIQKDCLENTDSAPNTMIAQSEVHCDPNTRIQTQFTNIRVRNASGVWVDPGVSTGYMHKDFPYNYTILSSSAFSTSRSSTTDRFIPLITECDVCGINP